MRAFSIRFVIVPAALVLAWLPALARAQDSALTGEWHKYRDRFIAADGRVQDTGNHNVSHTEGQGWAMLFAESFDDRATFDTVWGWTRQTLQHSDSALFSWRWDPNSKTPIADTNNATDGDILIAWALARAAYRWHAPAYTVAARHIVIDIRKKLITRVAGQLVLLPGMAGFSHDDGSVIVNPSYYVYPAFEEFAHLDAPAEWRRLRYDGLRLLAKARFGQWNLPADWVVIDRQGGVSPASQPAPRFGFDAIRIPLYLVWGREATAQRLKAVLAFWNAFTGKPMPAWVDVTNGNLASFAAPSGFQSVIDLARLRLHDTPPQWPEIDDKDDYYSASLILLSDLARCAVEP
jgi:endo-1,4-beta-D-glucanase Y